MMSAIVHDMLARWQESAALAEEHLAVRGPVGPASAIAYGLRILARAVGELGDLDRATALVEEALGIFREVGDKRGTGIAHCDFGHLALLDGDAVRAISVLKTGPPVLQEIGDRWMIALYLYEMADARTLQGSLQPRLQNSAGAEGDAAAGPFLDAARLRAAFDAQRQADGIALFPALRATFDRNQAILGERLGEEPFAQAWAEGGAMALDQAVAYALAISSSPEPQPGMTPDRAGGKVGSAIDAAQARLTPREREIVVQVARGRTNRQIAETLVLSERTVETHVHNILAKLELTSRAQIAVWAVERGLGAASRH